MADPLDVAQPKKVGDKGIDPVKQMSDDARDALFKQLQMGQDMKKAERANPTVLDLAGETLHSAAYSGVQAPITSIGQIADNLISKGNLKTNIAEALTVLPAPEHEDFGTARWHAQQIGGAGGMILPFMLTKSTLSATGLSFAARTEAGVLASSRLMSTANAGLIADGAISGFAYDFLLRPVEQKDMNKFWVARTEHGLTGAATFGTLTAGSVGLRQLTRPLASTIANSPKAAQVMYDIGMGALPGIPAGIVNADVNARLTEGRWATAEERKQGAYTMFMAGGALSALHTIPGSEVPIGDVARAYAARKAGVNNLNEMLASRSSAEAAKPTVAGPESKLTGRGDKLGAAAMLKEGRAMASTDAEPTGKPGEKPAGAEKAGETKTAQPMEADFQVPKGLEATFEKGVNLAFKGSDVECTPQDVVDFFNFARGEGAPLRNQMMEVAKAYADDPRMMTLIREAYMPPEGVEHRVIEGDIKLKTPNATPDQYARWGQFMQIVREMPQDVNGYSNFRHDVFRWLNENKDLHDWARQYGEQNRYSKIAGPLDYYFGTSNLSRFVAAADAKAATAPAKATPPEAQPHIRIDLTAAEAHQGRVANGATDASGLPVLGVEALGVVAGSRTLADGKSTAAPEGTRVADPMRVEAPPVVREQTMDQKMAAFEKAGPHRQKIDAMTLSENFGQMTTEQFAQWLDYAYAKPAGATSDGATNLRSLWINNRDALLSPEVTEAYKQYRGYGEAPAEGAPPTIPLETIRQFLSAPKTAEAQPLPEWFKFYVDARIEQAQATAKPDAKPHEVLDAALPRWLVDGLRSQHTVDAKIAGESPTYKETLPPELARLLEDARVSQGPKKPRTDGKPEREFKPPTNDAAFRLGKLNEIMQVEDPIIRENLLRLGAQDHTSLRSIMGKLDPTRSAPEYQDLLRMVLPKAENANDVKILLDAIFFGNKNHRTDRDSQLTKSHQQLAMATAEHLVPQSDANFGKVQQLVDDFISGKIRDPRPPRFGEEPGRGGDFGRGGRDGGRDGGKDAGRGQPEKKDGAGLVGQKPVGPVSPRIVAPPRPPQEVVIKDAPPAPPVRVETAPAPERVDTAPAPERVDTAPAPERVDTAPPPERVETAPPPERVETVTPDPAKAPDTVGDSGTGSAKVVVDPATTGDGKTVQRDATETPAEGRAADAPALKNGQKIKVGDKAAYYVGADAHTGETIVRAAGKQAEGKGTFYTPKQLGKLKLQDVVTDKAAGNRQIVRNRDGVFYEVHEHGPGFMVTERPDYSVAKPGDIK